MKLLVNLNTYEVATLTNQNADFDDRGIDTQKCCARVIVEFKPDPQFKFQHPAPTTPNTSAIDYFPARQESRFVLNGENVRFSEEKFAQAWPAGFISFINVVAAVENYLRGISYEPQLQSILADAVDRA